MKQSRSTLRKVKKTGNKKARKTIKKSGFSKRK